MTNPPVQNNSNPARVKTPGVASVFFVISPFMLLFGGFLAQVNASVTASYGVFQTQLGSAIFLVGVAFLVTAILLVGMRSMAQQQLDILLERERP